MKPLHHYLRRFCSEQVQILLQRMDDFYADEFAGYDSKWEPYVSSGGEAFNRYTKIEEFCVNRTRIEQNKIYRRQQMLDGILVRTMSTAKTAHAFNRELEQEQAREAQVSASPTKMVVSRAQYEMAKKLMDPQLIAAAQYAKYQQHQQHVDLHNKLANWLKP